MSGKNELGLAIASVMPNNNKKTVTTRHADYTRMQAKWARCRDSANGLDAVRARTSAYLPKLEQQSDTDYQAYLNRAVFFNATWRTICGLTGMLFRRPELIEAPDAIKAMFDDITLAKEPLHAFAQELAEECFEVGRVGVLVDYPTRQEAQPTEGANYPTMTVGRAQALNLRPVLARYTAETIINWRLGLVNNVSRLLLVVLTEDAYLPTDEFSGKCETRYRVLDLVADPDAPGQLAYRVRVFRINEKIDSQEQVGADFYPLMNGKRLVDIPFIFFGTDSITATVDDPPLIDLVDLNLAHFRVSADYEHGCHFTALPTAVVSGYQPTLEGEKLYIGSTFAWVFPDASTHATFLEFSGSGLGMLASNLAQKEAQIAILGARLLTNDAGNNQTATTAAIHHGGETAILSAVAQCLSLGLTRALNLFAQWAGVSTPIKFELSRDFFPMKMDSGTLAGLVGAWQSGAISFDTLYANLQLGEIVAAERSMAEELAAIRAGAAQIAAALKANSPVAAPALPGAPAAPGAKP